MHGGDEEVVILMGRKKLIGSQDCPKKQLSTFLVAFTTLYSFFTFVIAEGNWSNIPLLLTPSKTLPSSLSFKDSLSLAAANWWLVGYF